MVTSADRHQAPATLLPTATTSPSASMPSTVFGQSQHLKSSDSDVTVPRRLDKMDKKSRKIAGSSRR
ncbi:hypothetical protein PM082_024133 [Marasmius tenuissimus]|nr:hypothetical protein PM082_024133 [Marasmius tenuissimus]